MLFALDKDSGALLVLLSPDDAGVHCKPIDVQDGYWLFFADDGSPLEALFERPNQPPNPADVPGPYMLQRAMSGRWLQERLEQIHRVNGGGLTSVAELTETLRVNRGKRVADDARRR